MVGVRGCFLRIKVGTLPARGGRFPTPLSSGDASVPIPLWRHSAPIPPSSGEEANASRTLSWWALGALLRDLGAPWRGVFVKHTHASPMEGGMGAECLHRGVG